MLASAARTYDPAEDLYAIHLPADPNGLAYDCIDDTLYVADGETGAVLAIEQGHRRRIATIDSAGILAGNRLGGIAAAPDGTLYVARLGHGHAGAIFRIADGVVTPLPQLSPQAWRLGLVHDAAEHALYAAQYHKCETGPCDGSIVRIDLETGAVSPAVEGLVKPVGVAKLGATLVVTDARQCAVYRIELEAGRAVACAPLATRIDRPDSIAACGRDSVVVTTYQPETQLGSVRQLWLDGRAQTIAQGRWEPRGIATDGARVFVAVRRGRRVLVFPI
jgi:DNA-binding beta-propeller fold protein YncE